MTAFPSPNHGERRGGAQPDLIVLHYTAMATCAEARARLCDPAEEVSAHWLISETGAAEQLVDEARRAWHAGAGEWAGIGDVNSHSIGIELANTGFHPFPEPQMAALEALLTAIMARWHIPAHRVIAHSDMAPTRKGDPGRHFDWRRLARTGLSVWPVLGGPADPADPCRSCRPCRVPARLRLSRGAGTGTLPRLPPALSPLGDRPGDARRRRRRRRSGPALSRRRGLKARRCGTVSPW